MTASSLGFLSLPGEIRNKIYSYVLSDAEPKKITRSNTTTRSRASKPWAVGVAALLHTSRQVRVEFRPLYLSKIGFKIFKRPETFHSYILTFGPESDKNEREEWVKLVVMALREDNRLKKLPGPQFGRGIFWARIRFGECTVLDQWIHDCLC